MLIILVPKKTKDSWIGGKFRLQNHSTLSKTSSQQYVIHPQSPNQIIFHTKEEYKSRKPIQRDFESFMTHNKHIKKNVLTTMRCLD